MYTVHLIGNAHLDPAWLWQWQEGYAEVMATFRSALDRMKEFDDFVFTSASVLYYEWVEETDPAMFAEIQKRVKEGRWVMVGGWLIQPDCNLPCGESFARQTLYGQRYLQEKFGVTATVGYNVDSFGHNAMLPQILQKSGMDSYVFLRPDEKENAYPFQKNTFLWVSPDGAAVKAFRIQDAYCTVGADEAGTDAEKRRLMAEAQQESVMDFYGVGNHGGGPTIKNILQLKDCMKENPGVFRFSSPTDFFREVDKDSLPVYNGDLHHHASGCYTASMHIKEGNRRAEAALLQAEKAGMMAWLCGVKPNAPNLKDLWKPVLFNQFHDILCGCCEKDALEEAVRFFDASRTGASIEQNKALQAIAWNIDTAKETPVVLDKADFKLWEKNDAGVPVVIFNPHAFPVKAPVTINARVASVTTADGMPVPTQPIRANRTAKVREDESWGTEIIAEVPAMGWRLYWAYKTKPSSLPAPDTAYESGSPENDFLQVTVKDGYLTGIRDKRTGTDLLTAPMIPTVADETHCDTWAHRVFRFDRTVGVFGDPVLIAETKGALRHELRLQYTYNRSTLWMDVIVYRDLPRVYLRFKVNWQEQHKVLKLPFATPWTEGEEAASVPYGFVKRPVNGLEKPMQKWVYVGSEQNGLGLMTDTRTAYDFENGVLRVTALRSPVIADHFGDRDALSEYTDQGEHWFTLALEPTDMAQFHGLAKTAEALLSPLPVIVSTYHAGKLPAENSAIQVSAENILVTSLKPAEDGRGVILHAHETDGRETEATVSVPALGCTFSAVFRPQEIKAFRLLDGTAAETDFIER